MTGYESELIVESRFVAQLVRFIGYRFVHLPLISDIASARVR